MKLTIKSTVSACVVLAAVAAPLSVEAEVTVLSGKGLFGLMYGSNESGVDMQIVTYEITDQNKSVKASSSNATFIGSYFTETECWFGYGNSSNIQQKVTGLLKQVTASGEILVTWFEYCTGTDTTFEETVSFNQNLTAMRNELDSFWETSHSSYGKYVTVNSNHNDQRAPATINDSSISSPAFGTMKPSRGLIGQSTGHYVGINRTR